MESTVLPILRSIYQLQPVTRRALAEQTGLSPARVSVLVAQLVARGLAREAVCQGGNPGRPATMLSLNPDAGRVIGLEIGGTFSRAVLCDLAGHRLTSLTRPTQIVPDRSVILGNIVDLVETVRREGQVRPEEVLALGVGVMAIVDTRAGTVLVWPNTPAWSAGWAGMNVPAELGRRLEIPLIVVDDAVRAMGVATQRLGAVRGTANLLYVFLGDGVGSTLFVDGRPYYSSTGISGELGHVTVQEDGPSCTCGNRGCLETLASTSAVLRRVRERLAESHLASTLRKPFEQDQLTLTALIDAARAGDKLAFQILDETGRYVGRVVAIALNLLGPAAVVLGGPLAQDGGIILEAVQRQVRLRALEHFSREVRIVCDDQSELGGAHGAALLALDALFSSPEQLAQLATGGGARVRV